jgi:hypothetical protein
MMGWSLVLPLLKRLLPLKTLARLMWCEGRRDRSPRREHDIARLSFALCRLRPPHFRSNCLERGLLAYRYFARANADPRLVIGVATSEEGLVGHAWVTIDDRPVRESDADMRRFIAVAKFGPRGVLLEGSPDGTGRFDTWA